MLPKLCHLDNDLVIIIIIQCIYCVVHMTYIPRPGDIFLLTVPLWPWPVIIPPPPQAYSCQSAIHSNQESRGGAWAMGTWTPGGDPVAMFTGGAEGNGDADEPDDYLTSDYVCDNRLCGCNRQRRPPAYPVADGSWSKLQLPSGILTGDPDSVLWARVLCCLFTPISLWFRHEMLLHGVDADADSGPARLTWEDGRGGKSKLYPNGGTLESVGLLVYRDICGAEPLLRKFNRDCTLPKVSYA